MSQGEEIGAIEWYKLFLREVMDPTARLIARHELERFSNEWGRRALRRDVNDKGVCGDILGVKGVRAGDGGSYYCITPMVTENEVRNILAHAGLAAATRYIGLVFTDISRGGGEARCELIGVCIASSFPKELLENIR